MFSGSFLLGIHSEKHKQFSLYWPHKDFFSGGGKKKATTREVRSSRILFQHEKEIDLRKGICEIATTSPSLIELNFIYKHFILKCKFVEGPVCISDLGHVLLGHLLLCEQREGKGAQVATPLEVLNYS